MFERKLEGRRASSKLPEFVELVVAKPLVSAKKVAKTIEVTAQAARRIVLELDLREMKWRRNFAHRSDNRLSGISELKFSPIGKTAHFEDFE